MFIAIFGAKTSVTDYGMSVPVTCARCHNDVQLRCVRATRWFHLFFVPVVRLERRFLLVCPICREPTEVGEGEFEGAKALALSVATQPILARDPQEFTDQLQQPSGSDAPARALRPAERGLPSGWYPDPWVRHDQRYFDGARWTTQVLDGRTQSEDAMS